MLFKILYNSKGYLINLKNNSFAELILKSKNVLKLNFDKSIAIEYSGCQIDADLFNDILESYSVNTVMLAFVVLADKEESEQPETQSSTSTAYTEIEYLNPESAVSNTTSNASIESPTESNVKVCFLRLFVRLLLN